MTNAPLLADLPLAERRLLEMEKQREIEEGLLRRHVADAEYQHRYLAFHLARALALLPAVCAKLLGK